MTWAEQDNRRFLHTVFRIGHLEQSKDFYTKALGLKVLRERDVPDQKFYNVFFGFGPEDKNFALELTYNYGNESYDIGDGFGHFGVAVKDVYKAVENVKQHNGKVTRDAGPLKGGSKNIAFVEDPTGYKWEFIERPQGTKEPLAQVMLRVSNLDKSIEYYTKALGMKLLRKFDNPDYKYTLAFVGYGPEEDNTIIELTYNYGKDTPYEKGNAYAQVALSTDTSSRYLLNNGYKAEVQYYHMDVYKTADEVKKAGFQIVKEPGPVLDGTKIFQTVDPDGYKYAFVDNQDFLNEL